MKRFSERMGLKHTKTAIQLDSIDDDLRNSLLNVVHDCIFGEHSLGLFLKPLAWPDYDFGRHVWINYLKKPADELPQLVGGLYAHIRKYILSAPWERVYELVEFMACSAGIVRFTHQCNLVLERERSAYRFVGDRLVQITKTEDMEAVEGALRATEKSRGPHAHLKEALCLLTDRKDPDYRNSIKESINAVEAMVNLINGGKATLGEALRKVHPKVGLHRALEEAFRKLYGWTSDSQGIRHALMDEPNLALEDAVFMLVSCSAFVSYLLAKAVRAGISFT